MSKRVNISYNLFSNHGEDIAAGGFGSLAAILLSAIDLGR